MNKFRKPHGNGGRDGGRFSNHGPSRGGFGGPARPRFGGDSRRDGPELFDAICSKCGKPCQVPFRPSGEKPVYCRACFGNPIKTPADRENFVRRDVPVAFEPRERQTENREIADLKQQIGVMNSKMDSILRILGSLPRAAAPAAVVSPVASVVSLKVEPKEVVQKTISKKKIVKKKSAVKKK